MPRSVRWRAIVIIVAGAVAAGAIGVVGVTGDTGEAPIDAAPAATALGEATGPAVPADDSVPSPDLAQPSPNASAPPEAPPSTPPTSIGSPSTLPTYSVTVSSLTFTDTSRSTAAHGGVASVPYRRLPTTIWYPSAPGSFPLVVFGPGFGNTAADYRDLLAQVAARGFVVAAPEFPLTSPANTSSLVEGDLASEPADLSFVATQVQQLGRQSSTISGRVAGSRFAVMGHSDGAVAAGAAAFNSCCIDPRIAAAVTLSGNATGFSPTWFPAGSPALLAVHGTADTTNPFANSQAMFGRGRSPKFLLSVLGGTHEAPFTTDPVRSQIAMVIADFVGGVLRGDQRSMDRVTTDGNIDGMVSVQAG
jgi:dienelactone hydrolase